MMPMTLRCEKLAGYRSDRRKLGSHDAAMVGFPYYFSANFIGNPVLALTLRPSWLAGVHLGMSLTTRMACSSNSGCALCSILMLSGLMLPSP